MTNLSLLHFVLHLCFLGPQQQQLEHETPKSHPKFDIANPNALPVSSTSSFFSWQFVPIPIYATLPNEGSTFGLMPVVIRIDDKSERTLDIFAPSFTYNQIIGLTGNFRWYFFPTPDKALTLTATKSQRTNQSVLLQWQDYAVDTWSWNNFLQLHAQRNIFFRYFGIGPNTQDSDETSYTRTQASAMLSRSINLVESFSLGLGVVYAWNRVSPPNIPNIPLTTERYPKTYGVLQDSSVVESTLDIKRDTRLAKEYSLNGMFTHLQASFIKGVSHAPNSWRFSADFRHLWQYTSRTQSAVRIWMRYLTNNNMPFYLQNSLGGAYTLRGFLEERFVDQGAWSFDLEQRITIYTIRTHGVVLDLRVDPFLSVGQVFHRFAQMVSRTRLTSGLGLRMFVHPNVIGRLDLGTSGDGLKIYVELGLPF